jgi:hypothetical protein
MRPHGLIREHVPDPSASATGLLRPMGTPLPGSIGRIDPTRSRRARRRSRAPSNEPSGGESLSWACEVPGRVRRLTICHDVVTIAGALPVRSGKADYLKSLPAGR